MIWWALIGLALAGDARQCDLAMARDTISAWARYAERYPTGDCVELAYHRMDQLRADAKACHDAKVDNTLAAWASYARLYPTGSCGVEAASELLTRRQRGEVLPPSARSASVGVVVDVVPDLGEPWRAKLTELTEAIRDCTDHGEVRVVLTMTPEGPAEGQVIGVDDRAATLCILEQFRRHPWPRPSQGAELNATLTWPDQAPPTP